MRVPFRDLSDFDDFTDPSDWPDFTGMVIRKATEGLISLTGVKRLGGYFLLGLLYLVAIQLYSFNITVLIFVMELAVM